MFRYHPRVYCVLVGLIRPLVRGVNPPSSLLENDCINDGLWDRIYQKTSITHQPATMSKSVLHPCWTGEELPCCWVDAKAPWSYPAMGHHESSMIVSEMVSLLALGARTPIDSGISPIPPLPFCRFRHSCQQLFVGEIWVQSEMG